MISRALTSEGGDRARVMVVLGTRPEAIKLAPVVKVLKSRGDYETQVVATGQHRAILDQVLELFDIAPEFDLGLITPRQTLSTVTVRALEGLTEVFASVRPDMILVQGDTTTTLAGALCGFYHRALVVHLEAGLRTGDRFSPFPEEVNRKLTTVLSDVHLAPTQHAREALLAEGVSEEAVYVTGNTVIDALLATPGTAPSNDVLRGRLILVTAHRRESWGRGLASVAEALVELTGRFPDVSVLFPVHPNPAVRDSVLPIVSGRDRIHIVEPLSYGELVGALRAAELVLTDSGGIQEEAPSLGKPVLVLRDVTERPEAIAAGVARLVGTSRETIVSAACELLADRRAYDQMARAANPYGDGRAAGRVVAAMDHALGRGARPDAFRPQ